MREFIGCRTLNLHALPETRTRRPTRRNHAWMSTVRALQLPPNRPATELPAQSMLLRQIRYAAER